MCAGLVDHWNLRRLNHLLLQIRHRRRKRRARPPRRISFPAPRDTIHFAPYEPLKSIEGMSSTYIPLDSWIYPAVMRLYGMGFVDTVFVGLRPWTRMSVAHMLEASSDRITGSTNDEAIDIFTALERDLQPDMRIPLDQKFGRVGLDSVYERVMGIGGPALRDSFHLGQTDINDFGRPYASGFNNYSGFSARAHYGMFSAYFRGEYPTRAILGGLSAERSGDPGYDR